MKTQLCRTFILAILPTFTCLGQNASATHTSHSSHRVKYVNRQYRFRLELPASWAGFSVVPRKWQGTNPTDQQRVVTGPTLIIRNPASTALDPHEDIPVEIFTLNQWQQVQEDGPNMLIVSAAPIPPQELGRNRRYVFALPPRYLNDELTGWEDVMKIVNGHPLRAY